MATAKWPSPGLRNVGSYQVSGHPYITGSLLWYNGEEFKVSFPYVTKSVTIINSGSATLYTYFNSTSSRDGVGGGARVITGKHYISLDGDEENVTFNVKCREIYVQLAHGSDSTLQGFECYAELTNIHTASMYPMTGSGLTD